MRSQIIANAVEKAGLNARIERNTSERKQWAEDVRLDSVGGPEEDSRLLELQNQMESLIESVPKGIRGGVTHYKIFDTNSNINLNLAGANLRIRVDSQKPSRLSHVIAADNPLVQRFYDLEDDTRLTESERERITVNVRAVIEQANTIKQLLEMWPECVELMPAVEERKATLPTVKVADLNALVGLPTDAMK
jgi:hypothetical protein